MSQIKQYPVSQWKKEAAKELYNAGWKLREEGRYDQSTTLLMQAFFLLWEIGDEFLAADALNHIGIGFKNLYRETRDPIFAVLTEHFFAAVHEIIEKLQPADRQIVSEQAMKLAESAMINGKYEKAVEYFEISLKENLNPSLGAIGNKKQHLGFAKYVLAYQNHNEGLRKEGSQLVQEGLRLIEEEIADPKKKEGERQLRIWQTGALLALSRITFLENRDKANELARKALKISQEHQLAIRLGHAKGLLAAIQTGDPKRILFDF